jgi:hypothetical protein
VAIEVTRGAEADELLDELIDGFKDVPNEPNVEVVGAVLAIQKFNFRYN